MKILLIIIGIIVLLVAVVLLRAMLLKPTEAKTAIVKLDESDRAK